MIYDVRLQCDFQNACEQSIDCHWICAPLALTFINGRMRFHFSSKSLISRPSNFKTNCYQSSEFTLVKFENIQFQNHYYLNAPQTSSEGKKENFKAKSMNLLSHRASFGARFTCNQLTVIIESKTIQINAHKFRSVSLCSVLAVGTICH